MQKTKPAIFRQGDILIRSVESIPSSAKACPADTRIVLAEGEATGHFHAIEKTEGVRHFKGRGQRQWITIEASSVALTHPEHATIDIPLGNYEVVRQREYSPLGSRQVLD